MDLTVNKWLPILTEDSIISTSEDSASSGSLR